MSHAGSSHESLEFTPLISRSERDPSGAPPESPGHSPEEATVISQRPAPGSSPSRPSPPFELGSLLTGERLNHFELHEYVGGGGMGAVFRALDTMLNREVALKVLSRDQGADEETRRRFQNEAQSAARLDHENIARVYYVGEDRGLNYIVFEFIDGVNLRELVERKGLLTVEEAISYTLQIAEALDHASSRDVVHRDIKPSNVIVTAEGRAKLVDMGLARLHQVQPQGDDLTASGVTLGTFDYISPEQARDPRHADVRSDIYSLGCTLYYMLTARPPFPEGTVLQKLLQHNSDEPPDPRDLNPAVPEELAALVRRMLAKDPRRRHQKPSELIGELLLLAEQLGCVLPAARGVVWIAGDPEEPAAWQRHLPWAVPVAALLAIVALLEFAWPEPAAHGRRAEARAQLSRAPFDDDNPRADPVAEPKQKPQTGDTAPSKANIPGGAAEKADDEPSVGSASAAESSNRLAQEKTEAPASPGAPPQTVTTDAAAAPKDNLSADRTAVPMPQTTGPSQTGLAAGTQGEVPSSAQSQPSAFVASGTDTPTAQAATAQQPAGTGEPRQGTLVVSETVEGKGYFSTLVAACAAARTGDVIELHYSGRRQEAPIALSNKQLIIRAKDPFKPVIVFRPSDPDPAARGMITINGGSLELINVALELELPRDVRTDHWWSLLETQMADSLSLEKCNLTVRNAADQGGAYFPEAAFIHVKATPGLDSMMMAQGMMPLEPVEIRLDDCIARGEAVFLRTSDVQPIRLSWTNGLLATSEQLLSAGGSATAPPPGSRLHVDVQHLTAAVRGGLCRIATSAGYPWALEVEFRASDSIILGAGSTPLVEQSGLDRASNLQQRLDWNGRYIFYQGFETFWKVTDLNSPRLPLTMSYGEWTAFWRSREVQPSTASIVWSQLPGRERAVHTHTPADYALEATVPNPPVSGASDARNAGFIVADLPAWPAHALEARAAHTSGNSPTAIQSGPLRTASPDFD